MLEMQILPSKRSFGPRVPYSPSLTSLLSSLWMSKIDRFWTFFMFGTTNPLGESIAKEMLWLPTSVYSNGLLIS